MGRKATWMAAVGLFSIGVLVLALAVRPHVAIVAHGHAGAIRTAGRRDPHPSGASLGRNVTTWVPKSHGGAIEAATSDSSPPCTSSQLSTQYWTSFPAMTKDLSGFNLTNISTSACELPVYPAQISLANSDGSPVPPVTLTAPDGSSSQQDFVDYGSLPPALEPSPGDFSGYSSSLELLPAGEAVDLFYDVTPIDNLSGQINCMSAPTGGSLVVSLSSSSPSVSVAVPTTSILESSIDSTGSAFVSCGEVVVSPLLTWAEAAEIVGPPTPTSGETGALPLVDGSIYVNAP